MDNLVMFLPRETTLSRCYSKSTHQNLINPSTITNANWVMAAGIIGFIGNELVAKYRIKTGNEIGSASLVADGKHSRIDGITSLGVLFGALSVRMGFPVIDPIIGIIISFFIFAILIEASKEIFKRLMDVVEPLLLDDIEKTALHIPDVKSVHDIKARWIGHQIYIKISIAVDDNISVRKGHSIAVEVNRELLRKIPHLKNITIHVDPENQIGEKKHI
ncbi:MAG: cation diffusion facilitator family transporter [Ignavibacteriaceae bacterium]